MSNEYNVKATDFVKRLVNGKWLPVLLAWLLIWAGMMPRRHPAIGMLLLSQFGLVLLWRPVVNPYGQLGRRGVVAIAAFGAVLAWLGALVLPFWVAMIAALYGERAAAPIGLRLSRFYIGLTFWSLLLLWLRIIPGLVSVPAWSVTGMILLLVVMLLLWSMFPVGAAPEKWPPVNVFVGLLVFILALLIGAGALLMVAYLAMPYLAALAAMMVVAGLSLGALAWLWSPRGGFAGLGATMSAQLLQLGTPFERWSHRMADLSTLHGDPRDFLASACAALVDLPLVQGGEWRRGGEAGRFGQVAPHAAAFQATGLSVTLYAERVFPQVLCVQLQFAVELIVLFHQAKCREQRLADYMYVEAVHETGARLTHDIKNLLQSLQMLVGAASVNAEPDRLLSLYKTQLPAIAQRLESTLASLRAPDAGAPDMVVAQRWLELATARWAQLGIALSSSAALDGLLDAALFDPVLDNLLRNALDKQKALPARQAFAVSASLLFVDGGYELVVEDGGGPVPASVMKDLFERPIASSGGYGLGLFQLTRLARSRQYSLVLEENRPGRVRFRLSRSAAKLR